MTHRSYECHTGFIASYDDTPLFERSWIPAGGGRASVVIIHGNLVHSGLYERVARHLAEHDFNVYAYDMRGIANSKQNRFPNATKQFIHHSRDLLHYVALISQRRPDKPLYVMGESLGGTLALVSDIGASPLVSGLILVAPGIKLNVSWMGLTVPAPWGDAVRMTMKWMGLCLPSSSSEQMSDVEPNVLDSMGTGSDLQDLIPFNQLSFLLSAMARVQKHLPKVSNPLFILHGRQDHVVALAGSEQLYEVSSSPDKALHIYPGVGHDCIHGKVKDEALGDIVDWLNERTTPHRKSIFKLPSFKMFRRDKEHV